MDPSGLEQAGGGGVRDLRAQSPPSGPPPGWHCPPDRPAAYWYKLHGWKYSPEAVNVKPACCEAITCPPLPPSTWYTMPTIQADTRSDLERYAGEQLSRARDAELSPLQRAAAINNYLDARWQIGPVGPWKRAAIDFFRPQNYQPGIGGTSYFEQCIIAGLSGAAVMRGRAPCGEIDAPSGATGTIRIVDANATGLAGGVRDGRYTFFHGTDEAGAQSLVGRGIRPLGAQEGDFFGTTSPGRAAQFGCGRTVEVSVPEEQFLDLWNRGLIRQSAAHADSFYVTPEGQKVINASLGK